MIRMTSIAIRASRCLNKTHFVQVKPFYMSNNHRQTQLFNRVSYQFSKKSEKHHKKSGAPAYKPKDPTDYMPGSQTFKKHAKQVQSMQTVSQQNVEQASLKKIITDQRNSLSKQLKEEHQLTQKMAEKGADKKKIFGEISNQNHEQKYFLLRPLKYLQSTFTNLFALNLVGYAALEIMEKYANIGWIFGLLTQPAASTAIALLIGYNLAFWVVRQAFFMHLSTSQLQKTKLNIVSSTPRNILELIWLSIQFCGLFYSMFYPLPIAVYQAYVVLALTNSISLAINLRSVCQSTNSSFRSYSVSYAKLVSGASMLILLAAIYETQIKAASNPEQTYDSENYRKRIVEMKEGYDSFRNSLKQKNFVMKEDDKINFYDQEE